MSFSQSCEDIRLETDGGLRLVCLAQNESGGWQPTELYLDDFIGNEDGWFKWGGENVSQSARDFTLEGSRLSAWLPTLAGEYRGRQELDLDDRISNEDGELVYR
ncbi:hypothetical protein N7486_008922 [Penicillium sp. IBT 16267x]|nr:hypothetical protein N7486_008922 [Penicillium sp. IBT 16267x]